MQPSVAPARSQGRREKGLRGGGGGAFEPPYPRGRAEGVRDRGPRDTAVTKWQSEDQSWLRNQAAKRPKRKIFPHEICGQRVVAIILRFVCWGPPPPPARAPP